MNRLLNSLGARVAAFILFIIFTAAFSVSFFAIGMLYSGGAYHYDADTTRESLFVQWCKNQAEDTLASFAAEGSTENIRTDGAFAYTITDGSGSTVYSTLAGRASRMKVTLTMDYVVEYADTVPIERGVEIHRGSTGGSAYVWSSKSTDWTYEDDGTAYYAADPLTQTQDDAAAQKEDTGTADAPDVPQEADYAQFDYMRTPYSITGYILEEIPYSSELYYPIWLFDVAYSMRYALLGIAVAAGALCVLLFVFLMAAAGRRAPSGEVTPGFSERIPFDLFSCGVFFICAGLISTVSEVFSSWVNVVQIVLLAVMLLGCMALALWWCMSLSVRLRMKTVVKSCLCYKILAWLWRAAGKFLSAAAYIFKSIPLIPKGVLAMLGIFFVEFVYIAAAGTSIGRQISGWFFERLVLAAFVIYVLSAMKKLLTAGKEIAGGNMDYRVDTSRLCGPLKEHGEDLNRITDGLNKAIADRVKSERFRTELITNVSHDIKTPLTSIINYVDLMEKEQIDNEKIKEYLEVLSRQSARLKKLIYDLLEASKASTGNLPVNPERCELGVLLAQTVGEYEEKIEKAGLELIVEKGDDPVYIMADRQHLWRIFDNLMNNVCKYSMPGTRVYLDLRREAALSAGGKVKSQAVVTFRNISKSRLTVSEEELTERFVRGDSSRNTEGSGLGLSIANSLTQLQKGRMQLVVDGDLFKVQLIFDMAE